MPAPASQSLFRARRLQNRYRIPRTHPEPDEVRRDLDRRAVPDLSSALRTALDAVLDANSDEVWFVRRLDVHLVLHRAQPEQALAGSWARAIARALREVLAQPWTSDGVVWFRSSAAHLSAYVVDRLDGCADGRWYHDSFAGLRALPLSAALRTALRADPERGLAALVGLSVRNLERALAALTRADKEQLLEAFCGAQQASAPFTAPLTELMRTLRASDAWDPRLPAGALRLAVELARKQRAALGPDVAPVLVAVSRAVQLWSEVSTRVPMRVALLSGDVRALRELGAEDVLALLPLLELPVECRNALVPADEYDDASSDARAETPVWTSTVCGGAFLLLGALEELSIERALSAVLEDPRFAAAALRRELVRRVLGPARARNFDGDPVMQRLFGTASRAEDGALLDALDAAVWRAWRAHMERHALDRGWDSEGQFAVETGDRRDTTWIALDVQHAVWIALADSEPDLPRIEDPRQVSAWATLVDGVGPRAELALGAQRLLRVFAQGLTGFARSSPEHLRTNVLELEARVREEPLRFVVELGSPPLGILLHRGGASNRVHRVSWGDGRPWHLFPMGAAR